MRGSDVSRSDALSPLISEFNAFLFASVGEENGGTTLTVLSAFARLGLDPSQESARLGKLVPGAATQRLTAIVSGLPNGQWMPSDAGAIAMRLVELLPPRRAVGTPAHAAVRQTTATSRVVALVFVSVLGGLVFLAINGQLHPAAAVNNDGAFSSAAASPSAGFAQTL
jgi:hypothetical protein